ncbi:MAG: trypsin-like peptidase domain-containing protein [Planctomycetota bacterium JB042]
MSRHARGVVVALAGCAALAGSAFGQIRHPGTPATEMFALSADVDAVVLDRPAIEQMMAEDEARNNYPLRYGAVLKTSLGLDNAGTWTELPDYGLKVWRLRLVSPGAYTIGVTFDLFRLPEGASVYLYSQDRSEVLGAYTHENNADSMSLGIEPVGGDDVTIELVTPIRTAEPALLNVGEVIHDYRDVRDPFFVNGRGDQGSACILYINCPDGANYQDVKRSVVRTLAGGSLCSGSILNNTNQDNTPYLLTANHCGGMTNAQFLFNYEFNGCGTGGTNGGNAMSGAQLQNSISSGNPCNSGSVDSQLYRLNNNIPQSFNAFYAGWNRSTSNTGGGPAVTIGHGGGNQKNMAVDGNGASSCGNWWQVTWSNGYIIGGNSGGPLFDGNKRVLGPACCVNHFNCGSQTAWYGKLGRFWNATSINTKLDPAGTGAVTLDGKEHNGGPSCSPLPTKFGTPEISSTLTLTDIDYTGLPSATSNNFVVTGSGFLGNSFGWILFSDGLGNNNQPFGTILVSGPNFMRLLAGTTTAGGDISFPVNVTAGMVGLTQYYQWAVRDPGWGGNLTLSQGLQVTYCQ